MIFEGVSQGEITLYFDPVLQNKIGVPLTWVLGESKGVA